MSMIPPKKSMAERLIDSQNMQLVKDQANKLRSKWRKVVTGDEKKRIRDRLREAEGEPKFVKFFDKVGFTFGVLNMGICQYFLLNRPDLFPNWYAIIMPLILGSRYYYFKGGGFQYFLIDFCYFTILCSMVNLLIARDFPLFFRVCFINCTGPLTLAIPVWRNSFVFHDYDKIVSVYIHILPSMLYYTMRHLHSRIGWEMSTSVCRPDNCSHLQFTDYLTALGVYTLWQILYLLKTEFLDKAKLDSDPDLQTSLRWLAKDTKNAFARWFLRMARRVGIFARDEEYDSRTLKTKLVFVVAQLLFTCVSYVLTPLMYYSGTFHLAYILAIIMCAVFNGASFYIEVFAKRYNSHLAKLEEMDQIARAARSAMTDLNALKETVSVSVSTKGGLPLSPKRKVSSADSFNAPSLGSGVGIAAADNQSEDGAVANGSGDGVEGIAMVSAEELEKRAESISRLTTLLQRTSDSAWLEMKELVRKTDELRTGYTGSLSEDGVLSPLNGEDYVVCGSDGSSSGSPLSQDSVASAAPKPTTDPEVEEGEEVEEEDVSEAEGETSPHGRNRNDSVLSIDR